MLASLALLTVLCTSAETSRVCSCIARPPLVDARAMATEAQRFGAVLDGTVVRVSLDSVDGVRATVAVRRRWKGTLADTVVVHTSSGGGTCGLDFQAGTRYLILASEGTTGWHATICSPSISWSAEAERRVGLLSPPGSLR